MLHNKNSIKTIGVFRAWIIWFLPAFFMFYQYGVQIVPSLKIQYIEKHYLVNNLEIALLSSAYLLTYTFFQIPMGLLIDLFDARIILTVSMFVFALGTFSILLSNIYYIYSFYIVGHLLMGLAATSGSIGSLYMANLWLSDSSFKLATSLSKMVTMLGVFLVGLVFSFFITFMTWNQLILLNLIFCLLLTFVFWLFIQDVKKDNVINLKNMITRVKTVAENKYVWICAIYAGAVFANIIVLTNIWRVDFLEKTYHLSRYQATLHNGFSIFGFIIGAPLFGLIAKKTNKLTLVMLLCGIGEAITLTICHYLITNITIKIILYIIFGFFSAALILIFILIRQIVKDEVLATAYGFTNTISIAMGMILVPITGELLDVFHGNYTLATTPVVVITYLAAILAFILWRQIPSV